MKKIILTILFLLIPTVVFSADPVINSVLSENGFLTITGTNFTEKTSGDVPDTWDDFEGGTDGNALTSPYSNMGGGTAYYDDAQAIDGISYYSYGWMGEKRNLSNTSAIENYTSMWVRWNHKTGTKSGNVFQIKGARVGLTGSSSYSDPCNLLVTNFRPYITNYYTRLSWLSDWNVFREWINKATIPEDTWVFLESYVLLSDPAGTANGEWYFKTDGTTQYTVSNVVTRKNGSSITFANLFLGFIVDIVSGHAVEYWVDDLYSDDSNDRVMLGTNETYGSNAGFAMQDCTDVTPDADGWDDTEIVVNYNQISSSLTEYVYVIVDGVASNSKEILEGGVGGPQAPPISNDCTVNNVNIAEWDNGDSCTVSGIGFGASGNEVWICDDADMGGSLSVEQTITNEGTTSIDFTAVQSTFSDGDTAYVFVKDNASKISNGLQGSWYEEPPAEDEAPITIIFKEVIINGIRYKQEE